MRAFWGPGSCGPQRAPLGPLGLGGVMGGEETGCTEQTVNVLIESASARFRADQWKVGSISSAALNSLIASS